VEERFLRSTATDGVGIRVLHGSSKISTPVHESYREIYDDAWLSDCLSPDVSALLQRPFPFKDTSKYMIIKEFINPRDR
jgi:hypothetical protein